MAHCLGCRGPSDIYRIADFISDYGEVILLLLVLSVLLNLYFLIKHLFNYIKSKYKLSCDKGVIELPPIVIKNY